MSTIEFIWRSERPDLSHACSVYRYFDIDQRLLYVGVARDPIHRYRQHRSKAEWISQATACVIEWHPNRDTALDVEQHAIQTESPLHNGRMGRKLIGTERRKRYQVVLEPRLARWLGELGSGNRSAGVGLVAKAAGYIKRS